MEDDKDMALAGNSASNGIQMQTEERRIHEKNKIVVETDDETEDDFMDLMK